MRSEQEAMQAAQLAYLETYLGPMPKEVQALLWTAPGNMTLKEVAHRVVHDWWLATRGQKCVQAGGTSQQAIIFATRVIEFFKNVP